MFPRIRLKQILFAVFTLIASVPVVILAVWVQQSALNKEISSVEEKHLLVARNLTGDLERYVIDIESSLELVAANMIKGKAMEGIPEYLDSLYLRHISIANGKGVILKQVTAKSEIQTSQYKPEILQILLPILGDAKNHFGKVVYSNLVRTGPDETTFYLVKALQADNYVIGTLTTTHIIEAQKKVTFGRRGHAAIVDHTGRAIAHPVPGWVKTMKDMSFLLPVQKMKLGETGVSRFYTPAMKSDMVAGYSTVPRAGWGVMIPQPFEELEERANDVQLIALVITLVGITIAGIISWYFAGVLSGPIQSVVDATELESDENRSLLAGIPLTTGRFVPHELRVLLSSFNRMRNKLNISTSKLHSKIDHANAEVKSQNELLKMQSIELLTTNKKLEKLTYTDSLTELFNRRHFDETLTKELEYAKRNNDIFSMMMIDLDHFKAINDKHGHAAGDKVLCEIASVLKDSVRKSDVVFRVGGEEFAIIFRHIDNDAVRNTAESLRMKVEKQVIMNDGLPITVTASIGIMTYAGNSADEITADDLYRYSDLAMYQSKKKGRNQVTHFAEIAHTLHLKTTPDLIS